MSGDREATSEKSSSVREGAGYDEVYLSGYELVEDLTWSLERELFSHSPTKEEEKCEDNEEEIEEVGDEGEEEVDEEGRAEGDVAIGQVDGSAHRLFILHLIWTVNDF